MTLFLATELGRMVTYLEGFLTIKSHNALVIWSYKVTWQTKIILKKSAYGYKLGRMITYLDEFLPVKLHSSRGLARSCDKLKPLYLYYQCLQQRNLLGW